MNALLQAAYLANLALHAFILALLAVGMTRCFKNPAARSLTALLGLLAVAVIPWISALAVPARTTSFTATVPVTRPTPAAVVHPNSAAAMDSPAAVPAAHSITPAKSADFRIAPAALCVGLWVGGSGIALAIMAAAQIRFRRWQRRLRLPTTAETALIVRHWPTPSSPQHVRLCSAGTSPCVFGLRRITLVLPVDLLEPGRSCELRWALRHEAAHLRGHDLRWAAAIQGVCAVYGWNPLVHHLARLWSEAREQCCDRQALASADEAGDYGAFLVRLAGRRTPATVLPMAAGGAFRRIKQRLSSLLADPVFRPCSRRFVAGGVVAALLTGAALSQLGLRAEEPATADHDPAPKPAAVAENPASLPQCKIVTRFVIAPKAVAANGAVLAAAEVAAIMDRETAANSDAVTYLPSTMIELNQTGYVACIWEHPDNPHEIRRLRDQKPIEFPRRPPPFEDPGYRFTGGIVQMSPEFAGAKVRLELSAGWGYVPGLTINQMCGMQAIPAGTHVFDLKSIPWDGVTKHLAKTTAVLANGESLCLDFGVLEPGKTGTLIVTPTSMSRYGEAVADFAVRFPVPPPSLRTPLLASGALIELDDADPATKDLKRGGDSSLFGLFTKEQTQKFMAAVKGRVTKLPPRRFESGDEFAALWPEEPQILVKASVSSLPVTAVGLEFCADKDNSGTLVRFYPGNSVASQRAPATKGAKPRLLLLTIDLPEQ
jgi:beta-lactamase regulating signal transducer with metallopeptidase domain